MQSAPNSLPTPANSTAQNQTSQAAQQPQSQQQQQQQPPIYETSDLQYYYAGSMTGGSQPVSNYMQPPQPGSGYYNEAVGQYQQTFPNGQQPQMIMAPPQPYYYLPPQQQQQQQAQGTPPAVPQMAYYPQPMGQMAPALYYPTMTAAPLSHHPHIQPTQMINPDHQMAVIPPNAAQVQMMMNANMAGVPQQIPMQPPQQAQQQQQPQLQPQQQQQQQQHQPQVVSQKMTEGNTRAPLTSSTPLPTNVEYEATRNKNIQFRYHRVIEHDDDLLPIDEISKITIDNANDDTMSAEKENQVGVNEKINRRGVVSNQFNGGESQTMTGFPSNYKTRLCMMHASGTKPCEMGSRCKFAHGVKELRATEMQSRFTNNKYKTKLCKNFARGGTGFCPYGLRCEFVHPTDKEFQSIPIYQRMLVDEKLCDPDLTEEFEEFGVSSSSSKRERFQHNQQRVTSVVGGTSSASKTSHPTKVLLKHRNVAGSMVCLSQTGRDGGAGGDFNSKSNSSHENLPPHMRPRNGRVPMNHQLSKMSRRMSLSQLKTKWTSEENVSQY